MKTRTILALTATMVILSILYYIDYKKTLAKQRAEFRRNHILPEAAAENIRSFTIDSPNGQIRIEKTDQQWRIVNPIDSAVDPNALQTMVETISEAVRYGRFTLSDNQRESFGLDETGTRVFVGLDNGESIDFLLGNDAPIPGEVYLVMLSEPDNAYVTGSSLRQAFNKSLLQLRDKTVIPAAFEEMTVISVNVEATDAAAKNTRMQKEAHGWSIAGPGGEVYDADASVMREVIGAVKIMEAVKFSDMEALRRPSPSDYPDISMRIESETSDQPTTLLLRTAVDENGQPELDETTNRVTYYAQRSDSDIIYEVEPGLVEILSNPFRAFRDRHLVRMEPQAASWLQVEWVSGNGAAVVYALEKGEDEMWRMTSQPGQQIHQVRVVEYLTIVTRLRVEEFDPESPPETDEAAGLDAPTIRITLANADRSLRQGMELGAPRPDTRNERYGRRLYGSGNAPLQKSAFLTIEMPEAFIEALRRPPEFFIRTPLMEFAPEQVGNVEIHMRSNSSTNTITVTQRSKDRKAQWFGSINEQEARRLPDNVTTTFLTGLLNMEYLIKMEENISEKALKSAGLDDPANRVQVFDQQGEVISGFSFGVIGEQQALIMVRDTNGVYYYVKREMFIDFEKALGLVLSRLQ